MPLKPLTPESGCDGPSPLDNLRDTLHRTRQLLAAERKRNAKAEALMLRMVEQLERQIDDLRTLYFSTISVPTSPLVKA
ncbi:MAG TPA: hypothetical protein VIH78_11815 [Terriglobales bacterium]